MTIKEAIEYVEKKYKIKCSKQAMRLRLEKYNIISKSDDKYHLVVDKKMLDDYFTWIDSPLRLSYVTNTNNLDENKFRWLCKKNNIEFERRYQRLFFKKKDDIKKAVSNYRECYNEETSFKRSLQ